MAGRIDLNSVIAMMNQAERDAASASALGQLDFSDEASGEDSKKLPSIVDPKAGKQKFDDAIKPVEKVKPVTLTSNMMMVDPVAQAIEMQSLDSKQQNYLMQAFKLANGRA
jgi:hypothetical protein